MGKRREGWKWNGNGKSRLYKFFRKGFSPGNSQICRYKCEKAQFLKHHATCWYWKTHLIYKTRTSLFCDISPGWKRYSCKNSWCMNKYSQCSQGSSIFRRLFFAHVGICFLCASSRSSFEEKGSNFPRVRASEWKQQRLAWKMEIFFATLLAEWCKHFRQRRNIFLTIRAAIKRLKFN